MIGHRIPPAILLSAFAVMMGYVGMRMWRERTGARVRSGPCIAKAHGKLNRGCYAVLSIAGAASGLFSGLFGVGGLLELGIAHRFDFALGPTIFGSVTRTED